jgi:type II secretory pathway pseudopilin PulG
MSRYGCAGMPRQDSRAPLAFTLIEMLMAMAITLVMMGAVVTLFANISNSVRNRRATTEMSGQLRHVRNVLQQDLQGATCPGVTWQRPEWNHGYIEIIEGPNKEGQASNLLDADPEVAIPKHWPPSVRDPEIDHKASTLPSSKPPFRDPTWATDGAGLGDADDILMLTVRNEHEPFNGRVPTNVRLNTTSAERFTVNDSQRWTYESIQSPLAEVVWFAIENPGYTDDAMTDPSANHFFGEPGFRTIYRRTLLIAPWLNPYRFTASNGDVTDTFKYDGDNFKAQPGLMRILPKNIAPEAAIAAIVAFQDQYDVSVRLEWDGSMPPSGRWKIMANTLGDLTKRENRFQHFGFRPVPSEGGARPIGREYPFAFISNGFYTGTTANVLFAADPELNPPSTVAKATAYLDAGGVVAYSVTVPGAGYLAHPFAVVDQASISVATARAMLNDDGAVVRVVHGPVPLWGPRRGEDVMMTDVLAFDLRVYDPGAPVFAARKSPGSTTDFDLDTVVTPSDPGWRGAAPDGAGGAYFDNNDHMRAAGDGKIGNGNKNYQFVCQGAYVDMGYGYDKDFHIDYSHTPSPYTPYFPKPVYAPAFDASVESWFFEPRPLADVFPTVPIHGTGYPVPGLNLAPGYCVYDTWSYHYENNGINEDGFWADTRWHWWNTTLPSPAWDARVPVNNVWRNAIDQGVDGLDNDGQLGVDDLHERETAPPYDKPLRGMQAIIRTYEHDSRAIRQVRINQHFMQE